MGYLVLITGVDTSELADYSIFSVTLAMFLVGSVSASDVRAGFTMVFWSTSMVHRVFGLLILGSASLLVVATLMVLFASDDDAAEMVIDAANVLFLAEVVRDPPQDCQ